MSRYEKLFVKNLNFHFGRSGMSKVQLATKTGLSRTSIDGYLTGEVSPNIDSIYRISEALSVKPEELISDNEKNTDRVLTEILMALLRIDPEDYEAVLDYLRQLASDFEASSRSTTK